MLENIQGDSWGSIPPLRMPSLLPHDLCHERNVSRWLPAPSAIQHFPTSYFIRGSVCMLVSVSQFIPFLLLPLLYPCTHSLCLCLCSCPENWCIWKLPCLCVPQKTLYPRLYRLCTTGMYCVHQVKRSPRKSSATSMVLLNLSMIPSNFDQISLGNDNGKLVIENDLKVSGAPN